MTDFELDLTQRFERSAARIAIEESTSAAVRARLRRRQRRRSAIRLVAGTLTAAIVVAGLAIVRTRQRADHPTAPGGAMEVAVTYEEVSFHEEADLTCPGPELDNAGQFTDYRVETWSDPIGERWRTTVTYPDGTTRSVIALGSFFFQQTGLFVQGVDRGAHLGCVNTVDPGDAQAFELTSSMPGLDGDRVFSMNPPRENAATPDTASTDPDRRYPPLAISTSGSFASDFRATSTEEPGVHDDSRGRPGVLWQRSTSGELSDGHDNKSMQNTTSYFVDPATAGLTEIDQSTSISGMGTSATQTVLLSSTSRVVEASIFSTNGFEERSSG